MNKQEVNILIKKLNDKWLDIQKVGYLCYDNNLELANEIVYKLFEKDIFNDLATYYRENKNNNGYIFKVLCNVKENLYFQFDIITKYGIDIPQQIRHGKFRFLNDIPKGWKDIWDLWEELQDEEE